MSAEIQDNGEEVVNNQDVPAKLSLGLLQLLEPPLYKVKRNLKELIAKQNKVYVDLSAEKFIYMENDIKGIEDMMVRIKIYREKLIHMKRLMTSLHHRSKTLRKRAHYIQTCKEKRTTSQFQKEDGNVVGGETNIKNN